MIISIEGCDGSGKTCIWEMLQKDYDSQTAVFLREPDTYTELSRMTREKILNGELSDVGKMFGFQLSRAEMVNNFVKPAHDDGKVVVIDRYTDSTCVYQAMVGNTITYEQAVLLNKISTRGYLPNLTLLLDIPATVGLSRKSCQDISEMTIYEKKGLEFQENVRRAYIKLATLNPERIVIIDASRPLEEVYDRVLFLIQRKIRWGK